MALAGAQRLGDAGDGVVVGEREQLDPGARGAIDHLGGLERAVGVGGVRLQVEAEGHPPQRMRSKKLSENSGISPQRALSAI